MPTTSKSAADSALVHALMIEMSKSHIDQVFTHDQVMLILPPDRFNRNRRYFLVRRAIHRLRQERGFIFVTVKGEGYRRLNGVVGTNFLGGKHISHVHNAADRGQQVLGSAMQHHVKSLSAADTRTNSNRLAVMGLVKYLATAKAVDNIPQPTEPYRPADPISGLAGLRKKLGV